ncbi:unnamed protein product [Ceutorhynchus assimilis]|uniref:Uncharacterized protein n=1 Tax=Ceutorhynchus assimilis TaxID=467358 RepID=A0A9N9MBS7_9CUCU|nr:unnamed protein product [Ceutorhynchus assimilis]
MDDASSPSPGPPQGNPQHHQQSQQPQHSPQGLPSPTHRTSPGPAASQGQENLRALQTAIDSMDEKGMQEDPRYSQLLALRARANGAAALSQMQMTQLR